MSNYLGPAEIQELYRVKRTTAYNLLKEYEKNGGKVIRIGKLRRVSEELFTEFLERRSDGNTL